jgi:pyruvate/2-oxoglutarate dehydrogenase complex dihydrolipoamide dehydrogenase (E3) component
MSGREGFRPDLVVIGAGMGGISCVMRARALGARVLLIEPAAVGGT